MHIPFKLNRVFLFVLCLIITNISTGQAATIKLRLRKRFLSNVNKIANSYLNTLFPDTDAFLFNSDGVYESTNSMRPTQRLYKRVYGPNMDEDIYYDYYENVLDRMYRDKREKIGSADLFM